MKRILCFLLILSLALSLVSCGEKVAKTEAEIFSSSNTVALFDNNTLKAEGKLKDLFNFKDIKAVYPFDDFVIALKNDGTLEIKGDLNKNLESIKTWTNIIKLSGTNNFMVGLKEDGTVVCAGTDKYGQAKTKEWKNIVDIATSGGHTAGLKKNGKVVAVGRNDKGQCNTEEFKDIVSIGAAFGCTIGIKKDATAVAAGKSNFELDDIKYFKNITQLSVNGENAIILQNDGSVKFFGVSKNAGDPEKWQNIIKVFAAPLGYFGIDNTGKILYVGDTEFLEEDNGAEEIIKNTVVLR